MISPYCKYCGLHIRVHLIDAVRSSKGLPVKDRVIRPSMSKEA